MPHTTNSQMSIIKKILNNNNIIMCYQYTLIALKSNCEFFNFYILKFKNLVV